MIVEIGLAPLTATRLAIFFVSSGTSDNIP